MLVDDRNHLVALGNGKTPARAKVVLHIDHDQRCVVKIPEPRCLFGHGCIPPSWWSFRKRALNHRAYKRNHLAPWHSGMGFAFKNA